MPGYKIFMRNKIKDPIVQAKKHKSILNKLKIYMGLKSDIKK